MSARSDKFHEAVARGVSPDEALTEAGFRPGSRAAKRAQLVKLSRKPLARVITDSLDGDAAALARELAKVLHGPRTKSGAKIAAIKLLYRLLTERRKPVAVVAPEYDESPAATIPAAPELSRAAAHPSEFVIDESLGE